MGVLLGNKCSYSMQLMIVSNNRAERAIKPVVMGRKNYMLMRNVQGGGSAAAIIYSLIETCKQNNVDPLAYLADVLAKIPTHPNKLIHELLPYHWKSPQSLLLANGQ